MNRLTSIEIQGYKSIRSAKLDLRPLNVLIGANGSGKSNLVSCFSLLSTLAPGRLQDFVIREGGAQALLFRGLKSTPAITIRLSMHTPSGAHQWVHSLTYAAPNGLVHTPELVGPPLVSPLRLEVYHVHDTSLESRVRQSGYIEDNRFLQRDAGNLAAFLYRLKQTQEPYYRRIVASIQLAAPFFDDFDLAPQAMDKRSILLNWRERGSDYLLGPHQLSDGTLRAMILITALLPPDDEFPNVIVIDEPELGLHPAAVQIVASLIRSASVRSQIILATQSVTLINCFKPEDIVVAERSDGGTTFRRLCSEDLSDWLEDYTLGQLWEKNVIGGRPWH